MDHDDAPLRLDLKGMKCPLPALHTRRALARAAPGAVIDIDCTDPMAAIDIPHLARQDGHVLEAQAQAEGVLSFRIRKGDGKVGAEKTGDGKAGAAG